MHYLNNLFHNMRAAYAQAADHSTFYDTAAMLLGQREATEEEQLEWGLAESQRLAAPTDQASAYHSRLQHKLESVTFTEPGVPSWCGANGCGGDPVTPPVVRECGHVTCLACLVGIACSKSTLDDAKNVPCHNCRALSNIDLDIERSESLYWGGWKATMQTAQDGIRARLVSDANAGGVRLYL